MIFFCIVKVLLGALALLTSMEFHSFYSSPQIPLLEYVPEVEVNMDPSNEADLPLSPDQPLNTKWVHTINDEPLANVSDHCLNDYTENYDFPVFSIAFLAEVEVNVDPSNEADLTLSPDHMNRMDENVEDLPLSDDGLDANCLLSVIDQPLNNYTENYAFPVFFITFLAGVLLLLGVLSWKLNKTLQQKSAMDAELQELRNKIKENQDMVTEHSLLQDKVSQLQEEKRCHEIQLREKEEELRELRINLQETQRLLDTKSQESETKVENPELEVGDKTHKENSPTEFFHNTDQDNYVIFKGEEIYCEPTGQTTMLTAKVEIDKGSQPLIVGKGGCVISSIEHFSGTEIHMPVQYEMNSMVTVTGDKENIQCALDMMEAILINNNVYKREDKKHANDTCTANSPGVGRDKRNFDANISFKGNVLYGYPTGQPELLKVKIVLPQNQRRALVGYKGRNVDCVQNVSKVEIVLPRFHENSNIVSVTGRKSNIQMALRMMEYLLRKFGY